MRNFFCSVTKTDFANSVFLNNNTADVNPNTANCNSHFIKMKSSKTICSLHLLMQLLIAYSVGVTLFY